jgi:hypothetical protein
MLQFFGSILILFKIKSITRNEQAYFCGRNVYSSFYGDGEWVEAILSQYLDVDLTFHKHCNIVDDIKKTYQYELEHTF